MIPPPNGISYAAGFYTVRQVLIPGALMCLLSWLIALLVVSTYWRLLGINL
jgi:hypothetical protein